MRLSELQKKDVICVLDGKKIGNIIDIKIEDQSGKVVSLIVEPSKLSFRIFGNKDEYAIHWDEIERIGEDVILVRTKV